MMKHKRLLAFLLLCAMLIPLAACGPGEEETPDAPTIVYEGEDPYPNAEYYTMVIGHAQLEDNPRAISLAQFAYDVDMATHGHVKVEVVGDSQLGTESELQEKVMAGTIQGMRGGQFDFYPRLAMLSIPFLTSNRAEIDALLQSDLTKRLLQETGEATGTVIINVCDAGGYRQFSNNVRPIKSPEDLKGLHMRTNSAATNIMTFEAMGATTTAIPFVDLYMALETGVVDGQENPWINMVDKKFYEVQKYFTEVNYQFHPDPFYGNAAWFNALPEEFQTILTDCAAKMGTYNDQLVDEMAQAARQVIADSEAEVYIPTAEEMAAFRAAVQPVYDQCVSTGICTAKELREMQRIVAGEEVNVPNI